MKEVIETLEALPPMSLHVVSSLFAYSRLKANRWNKAMTCDELEISPGVLRRMLRQLNLPQESVQHKRKPKPKTMPEMSV